MPNPKRKHSHARSAKRRTHYTTDLPEITPNKHAGGEPFRPAHTASTNGYYKGRRLPGFKD
ncbi:MAG TPA: 50S ribosomal protein L32 [Fimbriimonadaceae bacterium]|nr:50S ribosomal protein L32 [Fimbriimonadaceae bacterium]HRJ97232.1 50S ribosomal protein L32 [Fimbriimonadaceae bacterium]